MNKTTLYFFAISVLFLLLSCTEAIKNHRRSNQWSPEAFDSLPQPYDWKQGVDDDEAKLFASVVQIFRTVPELGRIVRMQLSLRKHQKLLYENKSRDAKTNPMLSSPWWVLFECAWEEKELNLPLIKEKFARIAPQTGKRFPDGVNFEILLKSLLVQVLEASLATNQALLQWLVWSEPISPIPGKTDLKGLVHVVPNENDRARPFIKQMNLPFAPALQVLWDEAGAGSQVFELHSASALRDMISGQTFGQIVKYTKAFWVCHADATINPQACTGTRYVVYFREDLWKRLSRAVPHYAENPAEYGTDVDVVDPHERPFVGFVKNPSSTAPAPPRAYLDPRSRPWTAPLREAFISNPFLTTSMVVVAVVLGIFGVVLILLARPAYSIPASDGRKVKMQFFNYHSDDHYN